MSCSINMMMYVIKCDMINVMLYEYDDVNHRQDYKCNCVSLIKINYIYKCDYAIQECIGVFCN